MIAVLVLEGGVTRKIEGSFVILSENSNGKLGCIDFYKQGKQVAPSVVCENMRDAVGILQALEES